MPQKHTLFEVRDSAGRTFEVYAPNLRAAQRLAQYRKWATSASHVGIRRILRVVAGEPWPVLVGEAAYITALREEPRDKKAEEAERHALQAASERRRLEREGVASAARPQRLAAMEAAQADHRERRAALDARLGRTRRIFDLPALDPSTGEWT